MQRRIYISDFILTAYRAGMDVFASEISRLKDNCSVFMPSNDRGYGANHWASTRIAAIASVENTAFAVYHVYEDAGEIAYSDEISTFTRNITPVNTQHTAYIFGGDTYSQVLDVLGNGTAYSIFSKVSFGDMYRRLSCPSHILSYDETGTTQLRIMMKPDYRKHLTQLALRDQYAPPPADIPLSDAYYAGAPFVMAADMNIRRVEEVIRQSKARGMSTIAIAALPQQIEEVFAPRYRDKGLARVYNLTEDTLAAFFGDGEPAVNLPFITSRGVYLDAPLIQTNRKNRE